MCPQDAIAFMKKAGDEALQVDGVDSPYPDDSYDLVVACDVIEHIDDDVSALREWRRVLRAGEGLLLTVPAYQWLWSGHDVNLHHPSGGTPPGASAGWPGLCRPRAEEETPLLCAHFPSWCAVRLLHKIRRYD